MTNTTIQAEPARREKATSRGGFARVFQAPILRRAMCALLVLSAFSRPGVANSPDVTNAIPTLHRLRIEDFRFSGEGQRGAEFILRATTRYGEPVRALDSSHLSIEDSNGVFESSRLQVFPWEESGRPTAHVLVVDLGEAMSGEPIRRARAALISYSETLGERDQVALLGFGTEVVEISEMRRVSDLVGIRESVSTIDAVEESGRSVLLDALHRAASLLREKAGLPRRGVVVVLSTGAASGSEASIGEVLALAGASSERGQIPIFSIGHTQGGQADFELLKEVSLATGADFLQASSPAYIPALFRGIQEQLLGSYLVRYSAEADGRPHTLTVRAGDREVARAVVYPEEPSSARLLMGAAGASAVLGLVWAIRISRSKKQGVAVVGRLVAQSGVLDGSAFELRTQPLKLGALSGQNDIVLDSATDSRRHAIIRSGEGSVEIEDLGSTNGTFVNGERISHAQLSAGDRVRISDVEFIYEEDASS